MEYEVVHIPIKRSSSRYYAEKRGQLVEPEKYCECCGSRLHRHYNPENGRFEDWGAFLRRKTCGVACAAKVRAHGSMVDRQKQFSKEYRRCGDLDTLYCNSEGQFYYKGKPKKVIFHVSKKGKKVTARVNISVNGRLRYYQASRLVAEAWCFGYTPQSCIEYIDGDIHNISADNLRLVSEARYEKMRSRGLTPGAGTDTYEYQIQKLTRIKECTDAVLHYFQTLDMEPVNRIVTGWLYNELLHFNYVTLGMGDPTAFEVASEAIARVYDIIISGHAIYNLERYCKQLLHNYKKKGWFGYEGNLPKEIQIHVQQLNLEGLCEKYRVTHFKK